MTRENVIVAVAPVDWTKDSWFAKYWAQNLTDDFKVWWIGYYGPPSDYEDSYSEQSEYWGRCSFSLAGWQAAKMSNPT